MFGVNGYDYVHTYVWICCFNSSTIVTVQINGVATVYSVLGIRIKNLSAVLKYRLLIAVPL